MDGLVCSKCNTYFPNTHTICPNCGLEVILEGDGKSVIDKLVPNCLVHRYDGSDLLEPAVVLKAGRTNYKVAIKLKDYPKPISVPKHKVYMFNQNLFNSVQNLRSERSSTMMRFEQQIANHWNQLQPYA